MSIIGVNKNHLKIKAILLPGNAVRGNFLNHFFTPSHFSPGFFSLYFGLISNPRFECLKTRFHALKKLSVNYRVYQPVIFPATVSLFTSAIFNIQKREVELWSN